MSDVFSPGQRIHIIGIGGAGMSALARLLHERGCVVSGCDQYDSGALRDVALAGIEVHVGHDAHHVAAADLVTASPAIDASLDELRAAHAASRVILSRADVMKNLGDIAPLVGFAGTHGKTTSTSMAVHVWRAAAADPSWLAGVPMVGVGSSGHWREGGDLLTELDESFGTFSTVTPTALGVLAVDPDHLDFYGDVATLEEAFAAVVARTRGPVVVWIDNAGAARLAASSPHDVVRVGRDTTADVRVTHEQFGRAGSSFRLTTSDETFDVALAVPGAFNVANAAVVAAVARARGLSADAVTRGLASFPGAPRRFEVRGQWHGTTVVDDYAHLPGEVSATIEAARTAGYERIGAIFQPHRVTRTVALAPQFRDAFDGVTSLLVTDVYSSGEPNPLGVTGELIATAVRVGARAPLVAYTPSLAEATERAAAWVGDYDLVLILGAGDVSTIADLLVTKFAP